MLRGARPRTLPDPGPSDAPPRAWVGVYFGPSSTYPFVCLSDSPPRRCTSDPPHSDSSVGSETLPTGTVVSNQVRHTGSRVRSNTPWLSGKVFNDFRDDRFGQWRN